MNDIAFGVFDHIERGGRDPQELFEWRLGLLEQYDAAGFFCYHVAEHHATPLGMAPSPGLFLAAAAQRTRRIHLGPLVYLLPLYNPLRLIGEICMIDQMSGGRLEVGVGRGVGHRAEARPGGGERPLPRAPRIGSLHCDRRGERLRVEQPGGSERRRQTRSREAQATQCVAFGHLRRLFNWAIATHEFGIHASPVAQLRPKDLIGKREARLNPEKAKPRKKAQERAAAAEAAAAKAAEASAA